jgi:hypothetical protein
MELQTPDSSPLVPNEGEVGTRGNRRPALVRMVNNNCSFRPNLQGFENLEGFYTPEENEHSSGKNLVFIFTLLPGYK